MKNGADVTNVVIHLGFNADPDPDPAFYFNVDPDPDPESQTNAVPGGSGS
jgi:hypothetical protein